MPGQRLERLLLVCLFFVSAIVYRSINKRTFDALEIVSHKAAILQLLLIVFIKSSFRVLKQSRHIIVAKSVWGVKRPL